MYPLKRRRAPGFPKAPHVIVVVNLDPEPERAPYAANAINRPAARSRCILSARLAFLAKDPVMN